MNPTNHPTRISVVGCGYLGAVHAACMADLGHDVVGIDVRPEQVASLSAGEAPFHEPGLPELLASSLDTGRLRFSTDPTHAAGASVHFVCVGTPQSRDGSAADLSAIDAALDALLPILQPGDLVVGKSTVPVGTAAALRDRVRAVQPEADLMWNPEFLREGKAVDDTLAPDRFVYGVAGEASEHPAVAQLDAVYADALLRGTPRLVGDLASAELVKVAANSFLATKISFANAMAEICEATGADVAFLADSIGLDERIGRRFLGAGLGFGGGCLPKDIRAFSARAGELGLSDSLRFLHEVDLINQRRRDAMVSWARRALGGSVEARRICVLGAAFKPDSDDTRDSPSLAVALQLHAEGADVVVSDPAALPNVERVHPELTLEASVTRALDGADLVVLGTEWRDFTELDPAAASRLVARPLVIDGRNCLDRARWVAAGWELHTLGRPDLPQTQTVAAALSNRGA